jgi:hypothetical protein
VCGINVPTDVCALSVRIPGTCNNPPLCGSLDANLAAPVNSASVCGIEVPEVPTVGCNTSCQRIVGTIQGLVKGLVTARSLSSASSPAVPTGTTASSNDGVDCGATYLGMSRDYQVVLGDDYPSERWTRWDFTQAAIGQSWAFDWSAPCYNNSGGAEIPLSMVWIGTAFPYLGSRERTQLLTSYRGADCFNDADLRAGRDEWCLDNGQHTVTVTPRSYHFLAEGDGSATIRDVGNVNIMGRPADDWSCPQIPQWVEGAWQLYDVWDEVRHLRPEAPNPLPDLLLGYYFDVYCAPKSDVRQVGPWWTVDLDTGWRGVASQNEQRSAYHEYTIDADAEGSYEMYFGSVIKASMSAASPRTRAGSEYMEDGIAAYRLNWVVS